MAHANSKPYDNMENKHISKIKHDLYKNAIASKDLISEHLKLTANAYERINDICDVKLSVKYPRIPGKRSEDEAW